MPIRKGRSRHITSPEELQHQNDQESSETETSSDDEEETEGATASSSSKVKSKPKVRAKKTAAADKSDEDSDESDSEESEDDRDARKGVASLIEIENPNIAVKKSSQKLKNLSISEEPAKPELSRREREQIEKQKAQIRYNKLHAAGKTTEAKADLAPLALIRQQRADPSAKRADPAAKRADPAAKRADPAAKRADSAAKRADPAAKRADPAAKRADPAAKPADPAAKPADPAAKRKAEKKLVARDRKGEASLIKINNPNKPVETSSHKLKKILLGEEPAKPKLSRREREQIEKQKHYNKLHAAGKTYQAKDDLARLALIRQQRADAAAKREAEKKASEDKKSTTSAKPQDTSTTQIL